MSTTEVRSDDAATDPSPKVDMKLEVIVIPVADVARAATFYAEQLGWRVDADIRDGDNRILQVTPRGSSCSVIFGTGLTPSEPGSSRFGHLVVSDIEAARDELVRSGVDPSEVFHDATGGYNRFDPAVRASGPDPERRTYASFLTFSDPDGNGWVLQEITARFPGRIDADETSFTSVADLAAAIRRASVARGDHEARSGDDDWADWYATYLAAEQHGGDLPS